MASAVSLGQRSPHFENAETQRTQRTQRFPLRNPLCDLCASASLRFQNSRPTFIVRHDARVNPPTIRKSFAFDDPCGLPFAEHRAACEAAGFTPVIGAWPSLDPSEYFAPHADSFSAEELAAARAALIEDGVFTAPDWEAPYLDREFAGLRFTTESLARAAVKFGWAVAYAAEMAAGLAGDFEINFAGTPRPATPLEHLFIALELRRRGVSFAALALRWPGGFEAAVEFDGDVPEFERAVGEHAAVARLAGNYRLSFSHAEEKFAVLPAIARECGELLHVKTSGLAWMAGLRTIARAEPAFFREILRAAQERFAFDKVGAVISTNEEDVRFLPEVSDAELERTFLEDPRGRQLLHVAAKSQSISLEKHTALHRELFAESLAKHLDALRALPSPEPAA